MSQGVSCQLLHAAPGTTRRAGCEAGVAARGKLPRLFPQALMLQRGSFRSEFLGFGRGAVCGNAPVGNSKIRALGGDEFSVSPDYFGFTWVVIHG